ncbi:Vps62-related protein [Saccharothrix xinjiangensis]|uniref:Vps62-related protein n=1 Tax=Saccharothrix xinjiangensis TaxID=204798 RepID=A0ABV9YDS7_9PSEU
MITQRYGPLELGFTTQFDFLWDDRGSGAPRNGSFWRPKPPSGWWALGGFATDRHDNINGQRGGLVARVADEASGLLRAPVDYELIWTDSGSGADRDGAIWRPKPPAGYVALGDLCWSGWSKPPLNAMACVRREYQGRQYIRDARVGEQIWNDDDSEADRDVSVWRVDAPAYPGVDDHNRLILAPGLFTAYPAYYRGSPPPPSPVTWALDLPAVVQELSGPTRPVMDSYEEPPDGTMAVDRRVVVPYTMVNDTEKPEPWRVEHSPFYTLERRRFFQVVHYFDNRSGSEPDTGTRRVTTGVTEDQSTEFSRKTGMSVSVEAGVSALDLFSAKVTVSMSLELGYSQRFGISEFASESNDQDLTVPAGAAGCLWSNTHVLVPIRKDGSQIGGGVLTVPTKSFTKGEYPPGSNVLHTNHADDRAFTTVDDIDIPSPTPAEADTPTAVR